LFGVTYRVAKEVHARKEGKTDLPAVIHLSIAETYPQRSQDETFYNLGLTRTALNSKRKASYLLYV